jgi:hypothetical protein
MILDNRLDRSAFSVGNMKDQADEYRDYWKSQSHENRIAAIEFLRHTQFGEQAATGRLQRVLVVSKRGTNYTT